MQETHRTGEPSSAPAAQPADRLVIRPARAEEARLLTDLSLRSKAVWGYDAVFLARCRIAMTLKAANITAQPHYVAELDLGELGLRIAGFYGFEPEDGGVGLDYLFVEPALIGRGIGSRLWRHAVATARRLGYPALIVVSDPHAEAFYLRMGARRIGWRGSDLEPGRKLPVLRFPLG
jgi:GNAT superfamily N-acetyltransferase